MGSSILFACSCRLITPRCISCWFGRIQKWRRLSPGRSVHRAKCRHDGRKKGKKKTA